MEHPHPWEWVQCLLGSPCPHPQHSFTHNSTARGNYFHTAGPAFSSLQYTTHLHRLPSSAQLTHFACQLASPVYSGLLGQCGGVGRGVGWGELLIDLTSPLKLPPP